MIAPSSYFPATFDLSNGPVQSVETSETDPRVVYDRNGFRATDAGGKLLFSLDAVAGSAQFSGAVSIEAGDEATASTNPISQVLRWVNSLTAVEQAAIMGTKLSTNALYKSLIAGIRDSSGIYSGPYIQARQDLSGAGTGSIIMYPGSQGPGPKQTKLLIDEGMRSNFLQLMSIGNVKLTFGEVGVATGGFTDVAHGLVTLAGAALPPSVIIPGTHYNGGTNFVTWSIESPMPDNAHFRIHNSGASANAFWLALGVG